jgi:hypothetical protein
VTTIANNAPLTAPEIETLARDWYLKLDVHASMLELLPMLADDGLEMVFPEATLHGHVGFEGWYQGVIRIFFDEVHVVKTVEASIDGARADVHVVVHWEASVWNPPAAKSERISLDADQSWTVTRDPATGRPVILRYQVNGFDYAPGSKRL